MRGLKNDLPFNASNKEDEVAIDFGAVDKFIDVAGVHRLSRQQAARPNTVAHCQHKHKHTIISYFEILTFRPLFSVNN